MQSLLILGRQPELGLAELESLYGTNKIIPLMNKAALADVDPCLLAFKRLGGSLKFAKVLTTLDSTRWSDIEDFLINSAPEHSYSMPEGKMTFGLSLYGFSMEVRAISKSALKIKRAIQKTGRSVRIVPNKSAELNTAQVIHNQLTSQKAWELLIIKALDKTYIAQTVMVQDIEGYAKRDQARPFRDSRIGMLPPKLAQLIINLASGNLKDSQLKSICDEEDQNFIPKLNQRVLDPFCGSGVVLQEAALMGYEIIGGDINPNMVEASLNNLQWLSASYKIAFKTDNLTQADARNIKWPNFDFIATETNLGRPLTSVPPPGELENIASELNTLLTSFLINVASQTDKGSRLCLAIPAWQISKGQFKSLPLIDQLADLGYNLVDFKNVGNNKLIYCRPDQVVARQLLTLVRK